MGKLPRGDGGRGPKAKELVGAAQAKLEYGTPIERRGHRKITKGKARRRPTFCIHCLQEVFPEQVDSKWQALDIDGRPHDCPV